MTYDEEPDATVSNHADHLQNSPRTCEPSDTGLTQRSSPDVLRELLLKRNLAEQSKWLNDETGDRSWVKHPTQQVPWMMNVSVERLQGGSRS